MFGIVIILSLLLSFASDAAALLEDNLDVVVLAAACRSVCNVVLGSGNPDMAGPGMMISYYLQIALSVLFGPLLPFLIWISKKRSFQPVLRRVALLEKLLLSVVQTSLFYSSSLFIAAIFRHCQSPSISEYVILGRLLKLQLATMSFLLCGLVLEWRLKEFSIPFEWVLYSVVIILSQGLTCVALEQGFPVMVDEDSMYYFQLSDACDDIDGNGGPFYGFKTDIFYFSRGETGMTALLIALPGIWLVMYLIPTHWKRLPEPAMRRLHWKKIKLGLSALIFLFLSYLFAGCIMLSVSVSQTVQENEWGYGQSTAVLLWAPFFFEAISNTIKHERSLRAIKQVAVHLQDLKPGCPSDQAHERLVGSGSVDEHEVVAEQNPDDEGDDDEIALGVNRRDTESRMEGRGIVGQSDAERAATWQCDHLQNPPEAHRLKRRFT
ncbi:hypothetical protein ONS96_008155 [Cadophora gregata f. sp. sojae]|nr:hypothetical protein ONS96_008155 [Cadophora gregata f. sp. sojae]